MGLGLGLAEECYWMTDSGEGIVNHRGLHGRRARIVLAPAWSLSQPVQKFKRSSNPGL